MKLSLFIALTALLLSACGGYVTFNANPGANTNSNTNSANKPAESGPVNLNANTAANANANANANAKPAPSGPKRISFANGAEWSSENIALAGGESKQFVINANVGQFLSVEPSSPDVKILMITKKNVNVSQEGSSLGASLDAKGDYIFEVRNPGSKPVKTSVKIQVTSEGVD